MMISYIVIGFSGQTIVDYNTPNLLDLVRLALASHRLQIEDFRDSIAGKNVATTFDTFLKPKKLQKLHHPGKWDIRVRVSPQNPFEQFISARLRKTRGERLP